MHVYTHAVEGDYLWINVEHFSGGYGGETPGPEAHGPGFLDHPSNLGFKPGCLSRLC